LEKAHELDNKDYMSQFTDGIGNIYINFGQYLKALDFFQQALKISRSINDLRGEGQDLNNIGLVYNTLGQYKKALEYNTLSLAINRKLNDKRGEGLNLGNIGNVYQNLGQYSKALDFHQQALTIHSDLGDKNIIGKSLTSIGSIYRSLGQYKKALDFYQQALKIRDLSGKHEKETLLINMGNVYQSLGQYEKTLDFYQQALAIASNFNNQYMKWEVLMKIGGIYAIFGEYQEALDIYQQASKIHRSFGNKHGKWTISNNIGFVYKNLGNYQKSKEAFQNSVDILEEIGSGEKWMSLVGLALTETKLNQFGPALQYYEQALNNIEKIRGELKETEHKISFMRGRKIYYVYDELIALLQSLHPNHPKKSYDRKAIEIFERKQGRIFLEKMGKSSAWRFAGVPKEISQKDKELEQQIATTRKERTEAFDRGKDYEPHRKRLENLQTEQADFEKTLQTDYPAYYALKYPKPVALETLQKDVLQADELLLIYNVRKETTDLWVIGKHQFQMLTLDINKDELQEKIEAFRASPNTFIEAIKTEPSWAISDLAEDNLPSLRQASYDLYQLLMPEKARTLLKDARILYIVPTGPLYGLPFGALDTHAQHDTPHYLIQDYPIAYLSSASLLKTIRDTKRDETSKRYPFLAFADPQYPKNCSSKTADATQVIQSLRTQSYLKLAGSENEACFKELPETKVQAETIAKLLKAPKRSNALQLRAKASRSNVFDFSDTKRLDDYQYVLFAAHAILPKEISYINQSAIVLSNPDTEGYLTMADAFALDMNADLVMLSACNTGRGKKSKGEGIRGLTRAFMYAGTPAVSVSLWSVESRSTKALSISLFKYLQAGKPLAQALRQSKLDLMADEDMDMYQHPYFWAPFVVFGDGN
jgi:CHAT domain-containing protein/tetratricopeptide (TPR) repeat protein